MTRRPGQSSLQQRLVVVQAAVQQLPGVAAAAAEQLLDQDQARQRAPDGSRWKRVEGRNFDPQNHIRYGVAVRGAKVVLESDHPAAPFTRWGTRHMVDRAKVPGRQGGAAWWPRILGALRGWHGSAP